MNSRQSIRKQREPENIFITVKGSSFVTAIATIACSFRKRKAVEARETRSQKTPIRKLWQFFEYFQRLCTRSRVPNALGFNHSLVYGELIARRRARREEEEKRREKRIRL